MRYCHFCKSDKVLIVITLSPSDVIQCRKCGAIKEIPKIIKEK